MRRKKLFQQQLVLASGCVLTHTLSVLIWGWNNTFTQYRHLECWWHIFTVLAKSTTRKKSGKLWYLYDQVGRNTYRRFECWSLKLEMQNKYSSNVSIAGSMGYKQVMEPWYLHGYSAICAVATFPTVPNRRIWLVNIVFVCKNKCSVRG